MATLYVADQDAVVQRVGERVRVVCEDKVLARVPARNLESVFVFGDVTVTAPAIALMAKHEVQLAFLDRRGRFQARLICGRAPLGPPHRLRAQYRWAANPALVLASAAAVVSAKLTASRAWLLRLRRNHPDLGLDEAVDVIGRLRRAARASGDLKAVRGIEGRGAAVNFHALRAAIRSELPFPGRVRRPPTDLTNALLSLGYSLIRCEVEGQLHAQGLDAQVGFLHAERAGRPALALDLMEEFRVAVVDRLVLRCLNLRIIQEADADDDETRGVRLKPDACRRFVREYDRIMTALIRRRDGRLTSWRRVMHQQAREMLLATRDERPYRPCEIRL